jgi:predicted Rossmann fold flavoprotein
MPAHKTDVLVIGGGAAGLMAAIAAARGGATVTIVEKNSRVGKKILATGNGRCNLSNTSIQGANAPQPYNHPVFVAPVLNRYDCDAIRTAFENLGLATIADDKGWVFPRTRFANSVLAVLLNEIRRREIDVQTDWEALRLSAEADGSFLAESKNGDNDGAVLAANTLVLACGAREVTRLCEALPAASAASAASTAPAPPTDPSTPLVSTVPALPVLGPLKTESTPLKGLDGVRANASARLLDSGALVAEEAGEFLFRSYGLSGIAAFNLSRFALPGQEVSLDFFPEYTKDELLSLLLKRQQALLLGCASAASPILAGEFLDGLLHTRLAQALLRRMDAKPTEELGQSLLDNLANTMKDYRLAVLGGPSFAQAQVTRGGLATSGFDPETLQSLVVPRLFAAGECLDVDGPCGGFNLHWAWASGLVCGEQAARSVQARRAPQPA